jgi:HK97 family phage major capsid protein
MGSIGELNRAVSLDSGGNDLVKAWKLLAAARGDLDLARRAAAEPGTSSRVREVIQSAAVTKAGVSVIGLSDALAWYKPLADGFFASMAEFSALAKIFNVGDFYSVPLRTIIPIINTPPGGDSSGEAFAKAMSSASFSSQKLEPSKSTSTVIVTNELARSASPAAMAQMSRELRRAAGIEADRHFLAILAATSGITTAASTGVTASAVLSDLTGRLTALTIGADSRLWWIVPPKLFKELSLLQGTGGYLMVNNKIGQISVAPSDAAGTVATLIDAKQVAVGLETVNINVSSEATIELDDNPTSTDYKLVSLFGSNLTALMAEVWYGCLGLRSTAITTLTGYS